MQMLFAMTQGVHPKGFMQSNDVKAENAGYVRLVPGGEAIPLPATDGTKTLFSARQMFAGGATGNQLSYRFKALDKPACLTGSMTARVFQVTKDLVPINMFECPEFGSEPVCLTQHQIVEFLINHRRWLVGREHATLFPFVSPEGDFLVAAIWIGKYSGMRGTLLDIGSSEVLRAEHAQQIVVGGDIKVRPQQNAL
jgi:hypothetical protein